LAREVLLNEFLNRDVFDSAGYSPRHASDADANRDVVHDLLGAEDHTHGAEPSRAHRLTGAEQRQSASASSGETPASSILVPTFRIAPDWRPYASAPSRRCFLARRRGYVVSQWQDPYNELVDAWPDDSSLGAGSLMLRSSTNMRRSASTAALVAMAADDNADLSGADRTTAKSTVDPSYWVSPKRNVAPPSKRSAPPSKRARVRKADAGGAAGGGGESTAGPGKRKTHDKPVVEIDNVYAEPTGDQTAPPAMIVRPRFDEATVAAKHQLVVFAPHLVQLLTEGAVGAESKNEDQQLTRRFVMSEQLQRFFSLTRWFDVEKLLFHEFFIAVGRDWVQLSCLMCGTKSPTQVRNYFYNMRSTIMQQVSETTLAPPQVALLSSGQLPDNSNIATNDSGADVKPGATGVPQFDRLPEASQKLLFVSAAFVQQLLDAVNRDDTVIKRLLLSNKLGTVGNVWAQLRGASTADCEWAKLPPTKDAANDDVTLLDTSYASIFPPGAYAARASTVEEIVTLYDSVLYAVQVALCRLLASKNALDEATKPLAGGVVAAGALPKKKGRKPKAETLAAQAAAERAAAERAAAEQAAVAAAAAAAAERAAAERAAAERAAAAAERAVTSPGRGRKKATPVATPALDAQLDPAFVPHAEYYRTVKVTYSCTLDDMPCVCAPCIAFVQAYGAFYDASAASAATAAQPGKGRAPGNNTHANAFNGMSAAAMEHHNRHQLQQQQLLARQPPQMANGEIPFLPCTPGCMQCAIDLANRRGNFGSYSVPDVLLPTFLALQARARQAPVVPATAPVVKVEKKARVTAAPPVASATVSAQHLQPQPQHSQLSLPPAQPPRIPSLDGVPHADRARLVLLHRARREVLLACKRLFMSQCEQTSCAVRQLLDGAVESTDQRALLGAMRKEVNRLRRFKHFALALACDRLAVFTRLLSEDGGGLKPPRRGPKPASKPT
jgi:hypothetical protein